MEEHIKQKDANPLFVLIAFGIIGVLGYFFWQNYSNKPESFSTEDFESYTTEKRDNWDLFLYSSDSPDSDYLISSTKGFVSQDACISEGVSKRINGGSFECSYKCKTQYTTFQGKSDQFELCEKTCDDGGCRE